MIVSDACDVGRATTAGGVRGVVAGAWAAKFKPAQSSKISFIHSTLLPIAALNYISTLKMLIYLIYLNR